LRPASSLFDPSIFLNTQFSNTNGLCSSLNLKARILNQIKQHAKSHKTRKCAEWRAVSG
jgi:hypothetical protein